MRLSKYCDICHILIIYDKICTCNFKSDPHYATMCCGMPYIKYLLPNPVPLIQE